LRRGAAEGGGRVGSGNDLPAGAPMYCIMGCPASEFEHRKAFRAKIKWRTGCDGHINRVKRSYGWNRTELTTLGPEPGNGWIAYADDHDAIVIVIKSS
jgi:hypothetical protein